MPKDPVTWQSNESPISSAKLNQMTWDWVRTGLLVLDSSGFISHATQPSPGFTLPCYLGWYPYHYQRHVWDKLTIDGMISQNVAPLTVRLQYAWSSGTTTWQDLPTATAGNLMSTGIGTSSATAYHSLVAPGNTIGYVGFRLAGSVSWTTGAYVAWIWRAYLSLSTQPPL